MSELTYSLNFNKNWLSAPVAAKQAFYQELNDIRNMLSADTPAKNFAFTHQNFDQVIQNLLHIYDDNLQSSQNIDASIFEVADIKKPKDEPSSSHNNQLSYLSPEQLAELETRLYKKLSSQLDDFLSEQMSEISENLRGWLKDAIKSEITAHSVPQTHI